MALGPLEKERMLRALEEDRELRYALMGLPELRRAQQRLEERGSKGWRSGSPGSRRGCSA